MLYFNTITPHNMGSLIKMKVHTTSYNKRFRRYEISKKSHFP